MKLGHTLLATKVVILGRAALIFGLESALYAMLLTFVSSRVVDVVRERQSQSRTFLVVSDRAEQIKQAVPADMERGVTVLHGEGATPASRARCCSSRWRKRRSAASSAASTTWTPAPSSSSSPPPRCSARGSGG